MLREVRAFVALVSNRPSRAGACAESRMTKTSSTTLTALMCGAVTAQLVAGKATRDALFLMLLGVGALPMMLVATAGVSIVLVIAHGRAANYFAPVPWFRRSLS